MTPTMTPPRCHPVVHLELHTGDLPRARDLYTELCGWRQAWIETRSGSYLSLELASVLLEPREGPAGWRSVVRTTVGGELAFWQPKRRRS